LSGTRSDHCNDRSKQDQDHQDGCFHDMEGCLQEALGSAVRYSCPIRLWNGLSTAYSNAGNGIDEDGKDWAAPDFKRT
jgi:hypothetical protein